LSALIFLFSFVPYSMEFFTEWLLVQGGLLYLVLGAVAGVMAGLLGVGGGLIIVPVLIWIFRGKGFDEALVAHLAIGTSLATIVATSISSIIAHQRHQAIRWRLVAALTPGLLIGAWLGSAIADGLPTPVLQRVYACFAIMVGVRMLMRAHAEGRWELPGWPGMGVAGGIIGAVSAVVGIGGGTMTVPFLNGCRFDMRQSVATSSACGLPIALAGALGFVVFGWGDNSLPMGSFGYVYGPAAVMVVAASILFAPLGARLAHRMPVANLKRFFALLLFVVGIQMWF
jgi:uncharacterized membrane protein YfcA